MSILNIIITTLSFKLRFFALFSLFLGIFRYNPVVVKWDVGNKMAASRNDDVMEHFNL